MPKMKEGKVAEFPALPLWTDAYLGDTTHLTTIEHGAYLLLLMSMWRNDGSLPDDDKTLARYCRVTPAQWARISVAIRPFLKEKDGRITQGRLSDELTFVKQNSKRQSNNAKARWLKSNDSADAVAMPNGCHSDAPTPTPTPTPIEAKASIQKQRASRLSPDWFLPKEWGEWAVSEGCSVDLIRSEADKFRDYWTAKAGASAAKLDWQATWRNWIRAAIERAPSSKQNGKRHDGFDNHGSAQGRGNGLDPALANILRLAGVGQTPSDDCGGIGSAGEEIRPFRLGS